MEYLDGQEFAYRWDPFILTLPEGNYTGPNLSAAIQELPNGFAIAFDFEVVYHPARGTVPIEAKPEGMDSHNQFFIPSDFGITTWENNSYAENPWGNSEQFVQAIKTHNLQSTHGVLRNTEMTHVHSGTEYYRSYGSGFTDLLNVHNVYLHCTNLCRFNSIGARGENTIIKKDYCKQFFWLPNNRQCRRPSR